MHYTRFLNNGDPLISQRPTFGMSRDDAFRHYMPEPPPPTVSLTEGCWWWRGGTEDAGYGTFKSGGVTWKAHRVSYELFVGAIPPDALIRHTCDHPLCILPGHLVPGDDADNNRDMMERGRNRQPKGEAQACAKLTEAVVRTIRDRYAAGGVSQEQLAREYEVTQVLVSKVVRRDIWKHVD